MMRSVILFWLFWVSLGVFAGPKLSLVFPANDAMVFSPSIDCVWDELPGMNSYSIQISTDSSYSTLIKDTSGILTNTYHFEISTANTSFYWRVRAVDELGSIGGWSSSYKFTYFVPTDFGGLESWLKPESNFTTTTSGAVATWSDASGSGNDLVQADLTYMPSLISDSTNPTSKLVQFDGLNDYLSLKTRLGNIRNVFWVLKEVKPAATKIRPLLGDIAGFDFYRDSDNIWANSFVNGNILNGITRLNRVTINGQNQLMPRVLAMITLSTTGNVTAATFSKDRTFDDGNVWSGFLNELLIFSSNLTSEQFGFIENYLHKKYSPPINLGSNAIFLNKMETKLSLPTYYRNIQWSTSETTRYATVTSSGLYFVSAGTEYGDSFKDSVQIVFENPYLNQDTYYLCNNSPITIDTKLPKSAYKFVWLVRNGSNKYIPLNGLSTSDSLRTISTTGSYALYISHKQTGATRLEKFSVLNDNFPTLKLLKDTSICSGIQLVPNSLGFSIKSFLWNNSITTSSFSPSSSGSFSLRAIDQNGCTNNTTFNVTISGIAPTVFFTSSVVSDTVCVGSSVRFSNGSTFPSGVNSLGYRWDFGNGISNGSVWTPQTTTYTASGQYFVTLSIAGDNGCSNTFSRKMTVLNNPVSIFTSSSAPYCQGDTLRFFNAGQANNPGIPLSTYLWNFGNPSNLANTSTLPNPTFIYSNTGTYTVTFQVGNTYGCKNSTSRSFQILGSPKVNFTSTKGCFGTPISFSDSTVNAPNTTISTRLWTFGNGSSSTAPSATITYSSLGDYSVTLLATNNVGCSSSVKKIISIKDSPVPAIAYGPACDKSYIQFLDKSVMIGDSIIYWSWQFGATQSSLLQNPKVILGDTGTYNVSLTVGTKTCTTAIARPERVKVNLRPVASFAATPAFGSPPLTVTLTSSLTGISRWQWNFGIQTVTSALAPPITTVYPDSGRYRIQLNTYLANGCVDSTERVVLVSRPIIDLSASSLGVTSINGNQQLSVLLTNAGNIPIEGVTFRVKSKEGFELVENSTISLAAGTSAIYTFSTLIPNNLNRYPYFCVEAWPSTLIDERTNNNSTCKLLSGGLYVGNPYPNPTSTDLYLPVSVESADDVNIILTDMMGHQSERLVYPFAAQGYSAISLPISSLSSGVYLIYLSYRDQVVVRKFVKN